MLFCFQAEDGIRDYKVTGVQTCALPICWHGEGAYFDAAEIIVLNDPNARQTALVTGDVDAVTAVDLKTLSLLKRNPNIEVDNVPSGAAIRSEERRVGKEGRSRGWMESGTEHAWGDEQV